MSNFRRGPNVSQYIANLNTVSPTDTTPTDDFLNTDLSGDLGPFLTTEFFDFDMGDSSLNNLDMSSSDLTFEQQPQAQGHDFLSENFDFTSFPDLSIPLDTDLHALPQQLPQHPFSSLPGPPIRSQIIPFPQETSMPRPQVIAEKPMPIAEKRPAADISTDVSVTADSEEPQDEATRAFAEEDKRRRNTAASARFRVKKKQREADLEKRAKEMTEKATLLENKVQQLEMENRWLKSLITEKDVGSGGLSVGNLPELYTAFVAREGGVAGGLASSSGARVDGVGTAANKRMKLERA